MKDLRRENVTFAASSMEIIKALHQPSQWPAFFGHIAGLINMTANQNGWDLSFEDRKANMGAYEIAKSVTSEARLSSYIANGEPTWLRYLFAGEKQIPGPR
ncbi:unnamed protein product [Microthlaspi erraticum]|uniref:RNase H type-1 domain-containing protein n=1 Tax=Microthlaspi erraticum TaxID=1685480 RepID=A0A6D2JCS7_9BRAS|nr:unnamed protein product [Microthlaspi erraticum]